MLSGLKSLNMVLRTKREFCWLQPFFKIKYRYVITYITRGNVSQAKKEYMLR